MKVKEKRELNASLVNMIAPMGFGFSKNKIDIGEYNAKVYGITRYMEDEEYGWMEPLMNIPGTVASIGYRPLPEGDMMDVINNNLKVKNRQLAGTTDHLQKKKLQREIDNSDKMLDEIYDKKESVGAVTTTVMSFSQPDNLEKADFRIKGAMKRGKHRYRLLSSQQKNGYKHMSPCHLPNERVQSMIEKPAPLRSVMGGFPFASSGFNDGSGYVFATLTDSYNLANSNMVLDIWKRGKDRNNSHIVLMGEPGVGKSTKLKDIETMEYAMGTRIFVIDPEREQKHWCKKVNGSWINAGGGSGIINPLQVRVLPKHLELDDEDDGVIAPEEGLPDLAAFLMHLKAWFQMACPDITISQLNMLESLLINTYGRFGMTWDTDFSQFKNTDYPIMADLLDDINATILENQNSSEKTRQDLMDLYGYINNMVNGSLQFLWNGHTTINLDSDVVVIDTYDLQNTPDYIKGAQYYNILTWLWLEATKNRNERVMIVADEAYLMIDRKIPQALVFLRNGLKRGRKYEISFVLVSHSVVDFMDESVKLYGQAVLGAADFKILMGCDGQNLKDTVDMYNLTEAEEEILASKTRGLALMIIASMHIKAKFEIADYKWEYIGTSGGR